MKTPTIKFSAALAFTVAVLYTACALAFAIAPSATTSFFDSWFHGINLSAITSDRESFTFGSFLMGLVGVTAYSFVAGLLFGKTYNVLAGQDRPEIKGSETKRAA